MSVALDDIAARSKFDDPAAEWVDVASLAPWDKNPRVNDHAVQDIVRSIERFGFAAPLVARRSDNRVVAGHTRLKAAQQLGLDRVPVRFLDLTDDEAAALALADNRLGELAAWDDEALAGLLRELRDNDFDIGLTGFDDEEVAALLGEWDDPFNDNDDSGDGDDELTDNGTARVSVVVPVTRGHDASEIIRAALLAGGFNEDAFTMTVV